ncbi:STAS domain-containing protein [Kitasatospora acidiphila]|uniref:STAS domain-containing protein n=1 Tax=Kitasatospora acidiphila TaxID=2567942 RepID=A0A540VWL3_9ACTN|nr:STAS domain-containing protein [Kitasatospora acidiphila]TQF01152.1 STAS domain-containing protein [Kitasatospora acidiphila]
MSRHQARQQSASPVSPTAAGTPTLGPQSAAVRFTVEITKQADGSALLAVVGEVDYDGADAFRHALATALKECPVGLEVDLAGLSFCDCAGLNVLLWARNRAAAIGCAVRVSSVSPQVSRLIDVTGTREVLGSLNGGESA